MSLALALVGGEQIAGANTEDVGQCVEHLGIEAGQIALGFHKSIGGHLGQPSVAEALGELIRGHPRIREQSLNRHMHAGKRLETGAESKSASCHEQRIYANTPPCASTPHGSIVRESTGHFRENTMTCPIGFHPPRICKRIEMSADFHGRSWSFRYECQCCGKSRRYNSNRLGNSYRLVCDGKAIRRVHRDEAMRYTVIVGTERGATATEICADAS